MMLQPQAELKVIVTVDLGPEALRTNPDLKIMQYCSEGKLSSSKRNLGGQWICQGLYAKLGRTLQSSKVHLSVIRAQRRC